MAAKKAKSGVEVVQEVINNMANSVPDRSKNRSIDHSSSEALMALHSYKLRSIQGWADAKGLPMKHRLKGIEDALKLEYPKEEDR